MLLLFEDNITKEKSIFLAYVFWLFLGFLGVHRFYTNQNHVNMYLLLLVLATLTVVFHLGYFIFAAILIWWAIDGVNLLGYVQQYNMAIRKLKLHQAVTV